MAYNAIMTPSLSVDHAFLKDKQYAQQRSIPLNIGINVSN